jgi:hypothetical protein
VTIATPAASIAHAIKRGANLRRLTSRGNAPIRAGATASATSPSRAVESSAMSDNESPPARYRRLASECLEVAYTFPNGERRTVLLQMAQVWQRLSDEYAASNTTPSSAD